MNTLKQNLQLDEIIDGCKHKNRKAQEALFKMFYGKMLAVIRRYISDQDSAQDILQEGFIKVFDKIIDFDKTGSFEGWMRRIMANGAIDVIRKNKQVSFVSDPEISLSNSTSEEYVPEDWEEITLKAEVAMEAIDALSPAYRTVFNLFVIENYSHKQIAELLGISEGTSKSNLAKAKMRLQALITKNYANVSI